MTPPRLCRHPRVAQTPLQDEEVPPPPPETPAFRRINQYLVCEKGWSGLYLTSIWFEGLEAEVCRFRTRK